MPSLVYIAIRDDSLTGSGTLADPFNGSTDGLLDSLLDGAFISSDITLVFGPGVFRTKGFGCFS